MKPTVLVSLPTFTELSNALKRSERQDMLDEDGSIVCGDLVVRCDRTVPQVDRLAAAFELTAERPASDDAVYEHEGTSIRRRCLDDGVHLIESQNNGAAREVVLPRQSVSAIALDLIECIATPGA